MEENFVSAIPPLHQEGFLRLPQVLAMFPVSRAGWYAGISEGRYPQPVKLGPRVAAWRVSDIRQLIESVSRGE